jgi:regulator of replication initiation timing
VQSSSNEAALQEEIINLTQRAEQLAGDLQNSRSEVQELTDRINALTQENADLRHQLQTA